MIIVEGPDGTGKTVLAKQLAAVFGLEYRRPPTLSSTEGANDGVYQWWREQILLPAAETTNVIYDRCFFISDPIYRLVSGKPPLQDDSTIRHDLHRLLSHDPVVIFCHTDWEIAKANIDKEDRGKLSYMDDEHARVVHWAYVTTSILWKEALWNEVTTYNYRDERDYGWLINHLQLCNYKRVGVSSGQDR